MTRGRIVIVGASLAGVSAAESLRRDGFDGELVLVDRDPHLPYDRPPLSKELLAGVYEPEDCILRPETTFRDLAIELITGVGASELSLRERSIVLANGGRRLRFDALLIATGADPRLPACQIPVGVHTLRTIDDALSIAPRLCAGARLAVIGAGFIGLEVAATARARGVDVTVVEALEAPLARVLPPPIGRLLADIHAENDVSVRCGVGVDAFVGDPRFSGLKLSDGTLIEADLAVLAIGVRPATDWLQGSGLDISDGVRCDARCRTVVPEIAAAGDVARWDHPSIGSVRIEHWDNAIGHGEAAARALLFGDAAPAYAPVPYVWSNQYEHCIQIAGHPSSTDRVHVIDGSFASRRCVALLERTGACVGAVSFGSGRLLRSARRLLARPCTVMDAVRSLLSPEVTL